MTPDQRKRRPIVSGVLDYFPDAIAEVALTSLVGNEQHNPGQPLHWDKSKSTDEGDALVRHLMERGTYDTDGVRHSAKVAWRALALLQREIESERADHSRDTGLASASVPLCGGLPPLEGRANVTSLGAGELGTLSGVL